MLVRGAVFSGLMGSLSGIIRVFQGEGEAIQGHLVRHTTASFAATQKQEIPFRSTSFSPEMAIYHCTTAEIW